MIKEESKKPDNIKELPSDMMYVFEGRVLKEEKIGDK